MSKKICNSLIVVFIIVCFTTALLGVIKNTDWKIIVVPLVLSCAVLLMYQAVIYKGKSQKLIAQIPWDNLPKLLSSGHRVRIGSNETVIQRNQGEKN